MQQCRKRAVGVGETGIQISVRNGKQQPAEQDQEIYIKEEDGKPQFAQTFGGEAEEIGKPVYRTRVFEILPMQEVFRNGDGSTDGGADAVNAGVIAQCVGIVVQLRILQDCAAGDHHNCEPQLRQQNDMSCKGKVGELITPDQEGLDDEIDSQLKAHAVHPVDRFRQFKFGDACTSGCHCMHALLCSIYAYFADAIHHIGSLLSSVMGSKFIILQNS